MYSKETVSALHRKMFSLLECNAEVSVTGEPFDGVRVQYKGGSARIGYGSRSQLCRGLFLLAKGLSQGKETLDITQKPHFDELGVMLSLQTPMTVDGVIHYMSHMAALGYTYILLYMETTYEVPEYPFFGYLKGRYTPDELRRIDAAGAEMGIEVIPCVQTLAHMTDYLRWPATGPIRDNAEVLLIGEEKTYQFIETLIRTLSGIFTTRKIHIGFDEARGMGLGAYLKNHPYTDRMELFNYHLTRVKELCFQYGLRPMMWSDMPFRLGGDGFSDEYDMKSIIPASTVKAMEGVELCFWDYYNTFYEAYDTVMKKHLSFTGATTVFSGGIWTLDQFFINYPHTVRATLPAMEACLNNGIKNVMATVWGNASNTNHEQSFYGLSLFSEHCYLGKECTMEDVYGAMEYLTKSSREFVNAISEFHLGYKNSLKLGGRLVFTDILYRKLRHTTDFDTSTRRLGEALEVIRREPDTAYTKDLKAFAEILFPIAMMKCDILKNIQPAYLERDRETLQAISEALIPTLIPLYQAASAMQQKLWLRSTKPFGIESVQMIFANAIVRLEYAQRLLRDLLEGRITEIPELEVPVLEEGYVDWLGMDNHMKI